LIALPAGTYTLTRGVTNPDDHSNGDLDVVSLGAVHIFGAGASATIIDANHVDRAFKIDSQSSICGFTTSPSGTDSPRISKTARPRGRDLVRGPST